MMKLLVRLVPLWLALLVAAPAFCQQDSPPLGDVAREKKPTKKAARVITNDDLPQRTPAVDSTTGTNSGAGTVTDTSTNVSVTGPANSGSQGKVPQPPAAEGKQDSPAVANLKAQLADIKSEQDGLVNRIKEVQEKLDAEQDPSRQEDFAAMLKRMNASLENRKSRIADLQDKIDQLQSTKPH
jgi:hypothetical protein